MEVINYMLVLLREYQMGAYGELDDDYDKRMIAALIELYEQSKPKPEPFVYYKKQPWGYDECDYDDEGSFPLYDAPPTREPLCEDALDNMLWKADSDKLDGVTMRQFKAAARLIEKAHGIGATNDQPQAIPTR